MKMIMLSSRRDASCQNGCRLNGSKIKRTNSKSQTSISFMLLFLLQNTLKWKLLCSALWLHVWRESLLNHKHQVDLSWRESSIFSKHQSFFAQVKYYWSVHCWTNLLILIQFEHSCLLLYILRGVYENELEQNVYENELGILTQTHPLKMYKTSQ